MEISFPFWKIIAVGRKKNSAITYGRKGEEHEVMLRFASRAISDGPLYPQKNQNVCGRMKILKF